MLKLLLLLWASICLGDDDDYGPYPEPSPSPSASPEPESSVLDDYKWCQDKYQTDYKYEEVYRPTRPYKIVVIRTERGIIAHQVFCGAQWTYWKEKYNLEGDCR